MKVVLDTNIFISALINDSGSPKKVFDLWTDKAIRVMSSSHQINELNRISRYSKIKIRIKRPTIGVLVNALKRSCVPDPLPPLPNQLSLNDPADEFLLATALAADADYLITGDARSGLLALGRIGRTQIVTARAFLEGIG